MNKQQISWILRASNLINPELTSDGGGLYADVYVMSVEDAEKIADRIMELNVELPTQEEIQTAIERGIFEIPSENYPDKAIVSLKTIRRAITNLLKGER